MYVVYKRYVESQRFNLIAFYTKRGRVYRYRYNDFYMIAFTGGTKSSKVLQVATNIGIYIYVCMCTYLVPTLTKTRKYTLQHFCTKV
ncbi:hypothetical protein WH47_09313 [Habropoda laboriosa]|uniref:Uncharacterized protein n=1 Tax=Habropoda laboriosa TaxID=597456 RepID=A0A0L7REU8_9HYME|nr:hypothetical protein WH47_09313 [Habropoda laboriosa]